MCLSGGSFDVAVIYVERVGAIEHFTWQHSDRIGRATDAAHAAGRGH